MPYLAKSSVTATRQASYGTNITSKTSTLCLPDLFVALIPCSRLRYPSHLVSVDLSAHFRCAFQRPLTLLGARPQVSSTVTRQLFVTVKAPRLLSGEWVCVKPPVAGYKSNQNPWPAPCIIIGSWGQQCSSDWSSYGLWSKTKFTYQVRTLFIQSWA
jgi:hypothetical protein